MENTKLVFELKSRDCDDDIKKSTLEFCRLVQSSFAQYSLLLRNYHLGLESCYLQLSKDYMPTVEKVLCIE